MAHVEQKNQSQVTSYVPWQEAGSNLSHTYQPPSGLQQNA